MTELSEGQQALLDFIRGKGHHWGTGITTHTGYGDEELEKKHQVCLELEKLGLIYRHYESPPHMVVWGPVEEAIDNA